MIIVEILCIIFGFLLGFLIIYLSTPSNFLVKYPMVENIQNTTYIDNNGQCYKYYIDEISCPIKN